MSVVPNPAVVISSAEHRQTNTGFVVCRKHRLLDVLLLLTIQTPCQDRVRGYSAKETVFVHDSEYLTSVVDRSVSEQTELIPNRTNNEPK